MIKASNTLKENYKIRFSYLTTNVRYISHMSSAWISHIYYLCEKNIPYINYKIVFAYKILFSLGSIKLLFIALKDI